MAKEEVAQQQGTGAALERESRIRQQLGVPLAAAGAIYLLGAIIVYQSLLRLPTVGLLQALQPALQGKAGAVVSPETLEVRYLADHSFGLIVGGVLEAVGLAVLTASLLFLCSAVRARSAAQGEGTRLATLIGGVVTTLIVVLQQVVRAVKSHAFIHGHSFSQRAVEKALSSGALNGLVAYLGLLAPLVLVVGMILVLLRAARVGLVPRWLRTLGIVAAVLLLPVFSGAFVLQIIVAGFMVALGFLFLGRLPEGDPPAWAQGKAIPWPAPSGRAATPKPAKARGKG